LPLVVWLVGLGAIGVLLTTVAYVSNRFNWRVHRVTCPASGEGADVLVKIDPRSGGRVDIERCSACEEPSRVDCDKACLAQLNRRA
jgi:hypothetical protein